MSAFLKAEWRKLLMVNYAVDKKILQPYLPEQTELDLYNEICYVSLIGFMFLETKIKGIKIPFHINFEEVNLRFYVKHNSDGVWKRGVVFIKEFVPKPALTFVANTIYGEHYETLSMSHNWNDGPDNLRVEYRWKKQDEWNSIIVHAEPAQIDISTGSEAEFITEHYWGYTKLKNGTTSEYEVEHPKWKMYKTIDYKIHVDFNNNYGPDFEFLDEAVPTSVFLAEGSEIAVNSGHTL